MDLEELKSEYTEEKRKDIDASTFDANEYYKMISELKGKQEFTIDGDTYKFTDDNSLNFDDSKEEASEIIVGIYELLPEDKKEEYLNEMLTHTTEIPFKATEYFEGIKREKEEEAKRKKTEENGNNGDESGTDNDNNSNEELGDNDYTNEGNNTPPNPEDVAAGTENPEEQTEENELSFEKDGPAITDYKTHTAELEKKLEELLKEKENNTSQPVDIKQAIKDELGVDIDFQLEDLESKLKDAKGILRDAEQDLLRNQRLQENYKSEIEERNTALTRVREIEKTIKETKQEITLLELDINTESQNMSEEDKKTKQEELKEKQEILKKEETELEKYQEIIRSHRVIDYREIKLAEQEELKIKELIKETKRKIDLLENQNLKDQAFNLTQFKIGEDKEVEVHKIHELYEKEVKRAKDTLATIDKIENEYIKDSKGIPLEFHKFKTELENIISNSHVKFTNIMNYRSNIRTMDPEFKEVITFLAGINDINNNISKELNEKYIKDHDKEELDPEKNKDDGRVPDETNHGDDNDLDKEIEELKKEIEERKNFEKLYYACLNDIKKLRDAVQKGLDPNGPDAAKVVEIINKEKEPLPKTLRDELDEYLNMALGIDKKKVTKVEKNLKKTKRTYLALAAGLGLGGVLGFTLGPVGLAVTYGVVGVSKLIVSHLQKEAQKRRLSGKKIEAIEEPSNKLKAAIHNLKEKALEHEDVLRDINWGLTGALVGLSIGSIGQHMANSIEAQQYVHNPQPTPGTAPQPTPQPAPGVTPQPTPGTTGVTQGPSIPGIGEHVNGLEYGYTNSIDAASKANAVHLNQAILNDGNTVVAGYRVGGQTLTNLPAGVTPDSILLTNGTEKGYRAWAAVDDVLSAAGKGIR